MSDKSNFRPLSTQCLASQWTGSYSRGLPRRVTGASYQRHWSLLELLCSAAGDNDVMELRPLDVNSCTGFAEHVPVCTRHSSRHSFSQHWNVCTRILNYKSLAVQAASLVRLQLYRDVTTRHLQAPCFCQFVAISSCFEQNNVVTHTFNKMTLHNWIYFCQRYHTTSSEKCSHSSG